MTPRALLRHADEEFDAAERLLEIAAVAKRLRRCPATIRAYIKAGRLRAWRPPTLGTRKGNYLVPESAVREFLSQSQ